MGNKLAALTPTIPFLTSEKPETKPETKPEYPSYPPYPANPQYPLNPQIPQYPQYPPYSKSQPYPPYPVNSQTTRPGTSGIPLGQSTQPVQPVQSVQNALAYNLSRNTIIQPQVNSGQIVYNDPNNIYILIDVLNLQNCLQSGNSNLNQLIKCTSSYIKGMVNNNNANGYIMINLIPIAQQGPGNINNFLSPQQKQQLQSSTFTAYSIGNAFITGQYFIDYNMLLSMANSSDINSAIIASIKGFNVLSNNYDLNAQQMIAGITIDSNGNIINPQSSEQNFQLVDNFSILNNSSNNKTIIFIVCIILYLVLITK